MEHEFRCLWCEAILQNKLELHKHAMSHYLDALKPDSSN